MEIRLYDPFENLYLDPRTCFLTGEDLQNDDEQIPVFPAWIIERYSLQNTKFAMMDQFTGFLYPDLKIPCSQHVIANVIDPLEKEIETAFIAGYSGVKELPEERLFQWMCKMVYGVLYNDLLVEKKKSAKRQKEFKLSPALQRRFKKLHLMLQSLVVPMSFAGVKPWSISIVKVQYSKDVFNYRDEPTNMNFSLGMNGFGVVACLQDNGAVGQHQEKILNKILDKTLHPVQFEELCARFIYSNYLLSSFAKHNIDVKESGVVIESIPMKDEPGKPLFAPWDDNMFAQVLADYWKPWGITKNDIYTPPDSPVSYLENEFNYEFIEPDSISLPY